MDLNTEPKPNIEAAKRSACAEYHRTDSFISPCGGVKKPNRAMANEARTRKIATAYCIFVWVFIDAMVIKNCAPCGAQFRGW